MIRQFENKDLSRCKEIIENCLTLSMGTNFETINFLRDEFEDPNYFKLRSKKGAIYVFEEDVIKGMGCADGKWIRKVFVDPKYQKKGIGTKILNYLEKVIQKNGFNEIFIYSYPFTKELCLKKGFKVIEEKSFIRGNSKIIGIKMRKIINSNKRFLN